MQDLIVKKTGVFDYRITFQKDFSKLSEYIQKANLPMNRVCVVSDSQVSKLYLKEVMDCLQDSFSYVSSFVFEAGEPSKNLNTVQKLYTHLIEEHFDRKDLLIALGGGVTGDLTGYAAATYLRGISFMQVPTTVLAQVDSSIGGKTGVDFESYKNMVGAFHHPKLVYMNMSTLLSLDEKQFACGMGEVLKTGLIRSSKLYEWTITNISEILERDLDVLSEMIYQCCLIKKNVVEEDPNEQGVRAILNLGHTVGHAIEKLSDFSLLHGQCVALGTIAAAYISYKKDLLSSEELFEIRDMNVGFDLPIFMGKYDPEEILKTTKSDKKMENGRIKFVLLKGIGHAVIRLDVTDEDILEAIKFIQNEYQLDEVDNEPK